MRRLVWLLLFFCTAKGIHASGPFRSEEVVSLEALDSLVRAAAPPDSAGAVGENTRWVSSALAVVLGPFGAHRLYLGTTPKVAIIYGITFGGFGVLALLDLGHLLFSKDLEPYRNNDRVFMWSRRRELTPP